MANDLAIYRNLIYILLALFAIASIVVLIFGSKNKTLHKEINTLAVEKQNEKNRADKAETENSKAEVVAEVLNELNLELVRTGIPILAILDIPTNRIFFKKINGGNPIELPLVIEYNGKFVSFQSTKPKQSLNIYYSDDHETVAEQILNNLSLINPDFKAYKPKIKGEDKPEQN